MLTFLIVLGVASMVVSACVLVVACMSSAQMSEREEWAERPLVVRTPVPSEAQTTLTQRQ
jgi:hypothetical protein